MKALKNVAAMIVGPICFFTMTACTKSPVEVRTQAVKDQLESELKKSMNDPDSYEFVSLDLVDSTFYSDNARKLRSDRQFFIDLNRPEIENQLRYQNDPVLVSLFDAEKLNEARAELVKDSSILAEMNALIQMMGNDTNGISSYVYEFKFRGNNAMGAKVLSTQFVQVGIAPKYEVIEVDEERSKLRKAPGGLPGYDTILKKYDPQ